MNVKESQTRTERTEKVGAEATAGGLEGPQDKAKSAKCRAVVLGARHLRSQSPHEGSLKLSAA